MYDQEAISSIANDLYHKCFSAGQPEKSGQQPAATIPESPLLSLSSRDSIKPASHANSVPVQAGNYYFLNGVPVPNPVAAQGRPAYDLENIRRDFPILQQRINGQPLIWFDNAATTQKPQPVIDSLNRFYRESNSNVHRGAHTLASRATNAYETARKKVQQFIGAPSADEIIFLRGTTEALNLVAQTYGRTIVRPGEEILVSAMEHHSNIVPWQMLCKETGALLRVIPLNPQGELTLGEYEKLLSHRTRIVAVTQVSNVLGTVNPVRLMSEMAHYYGACIVVDGAQAAPHLKVDLADMDADFYAFSGHKIYGPTGIGVLYGKKFLLEEMPPWQGGGGMIRNVTMEETTYNSPPHKFEAGTVNIADAVSLGAAIDYLQGIGISNIERHEQELTNYATEVLTKIPGLRLFGTSPNKIGVLSFVIAGVSTDDLARYLDQSGIAVRTGHHCAQPLMQYYGQKGMLRVSLGLYNSREEIDRLAQVIRETV